MRLIETNCMNAPEGLQFVDTNILVYAHDSSAGCKQTEARELLRSLWQSGDGCISIQVLQEFYVTVTRKVAKPLSPDAASRIIGDLSAWQVHRPGVEDVQNAIRLQQRYQTSFWDAMVLTSALQMGCRTIWSEDLSAGQVYERVTVQSPF